MNVDAIVATITVAIIGALVVALKLSESRRAKAETDALKAGTKAEQDAYADNQKKLDEVISEAEQKRQESLHNLDLLKHAVWRPSGDYGRRDFDV
jgi:FtsZ-interacting cell division protein ZipA